MRMEFTVCNVLEGALQPVEIGLDRGGAQARHLIEVAGAPDWRNVTSRSVIS